jgi:hypothetical protein
VNTSEKIDRDDDYAIVHADGIKLRLGDEVSKLIFYQEDLRPTEDGKLDADEQHKILTFEVRLPREVLRRLSGFVVSGLEAVDRTWDAVDKIQDKKTKELHDKFLDEIESYLFDTDPNQPSDRKIQEIVDRIYDVLGRAEREIKEKASHQLE